MLGTAWCPSSLLVVGHVPDVAPHINSSEEYMVNAKYDGSKLRSTLYLISGAISYIQIEDFSLTRGGEQATEWLF